MTKREVQAVKAPEPFPEAPEPTVEKQEQKPAAKPAAKKAPVKKGTARKAVNEQQEVEVLFIRSVGETFRRGGCGFNQKGEYFAVDYFTDQQMAAIKAEPELLVKQVALSIEEAQQTVIIGIDA